MDLAATAAAKPGEGRIADATAPAAAVADAQAPPTARP